MNEELEHIDDEQDDSDLFEHFRVVADPNQKVLRLDKFLIDKLPNVTRNRIQNAIKDGFIKVNEQETKSNYKVRPDDTVVVSLPTPPRNEEVLPEDIPLNIVYEDEYLMVVNKDPGMVVHPAHSNWTGTLVNALVHHFDGLPTH